VNAVTLLLALYNGEAYLRAQLQSIEGQTFRDWTLLISDDHSTDAGLSIVKEFAAKFPPDKIRVLQGPAMGGAANFLYLLTQAPKDARYCAFSDQDDVWLPHKLMRAIAALASMGDRPAAYFSRTLICSMDLSAPHASRRPRKAFGFRNALVQNVMPGNTIVMNTAARDLLQNIIAETGADVLARVVVHDWWIYQMLSGCGAQLIWDDEPGLFYRQHSGNQIGANDGLRAQMVRLGLMLRGGYADWNRRNLLALKDATPWFTAENQCLLAAFEELRGTKGALARLRLLRRAGLYRQGAMGQASLYLTALINRL
jgi:glycosyltransferase involved in cell wall biosynthesis